MTWTKEIIQSIVAYEVFGAILNNIEKYTAFITSHRAIELLNDFKMTNDDDKIYTFGVFSVHSFFQDCHNFFFLI